ncbi:MAG: glutamine synthetase family protein, partial [Elusimicrobia bacterium]|nr:glutamine synthetase family protein [Elusimicrobiota bacterium]
MRRDKNKIKEILKAVKKENIQFVKLWFVDILGGLKSLSISSRELEHAMAEGMGFDGSSVEGFARIYESDLLAMPDLETFRVMPWKFDGMLTARMFCDIVTPEGKQYDGDPRWVLKKNLLRMKELGFDNFMVGPELEYFYFKSDKAPEPMDEGGYFDTVPIDESHDLRRQTMAMLEQMGVAVEYSHHENAPSQHEIDLRYDTALEMADRVITYKVVVKQVAANQGCYATFMPKPLSGVNGSGMHVHQSLFKGRENTFFNPKDEYFLSDTAKHFMAGILYHVRAICSVTNQWVNSYKRLIPGFEAPVYIAWAKRNRSALLRVPQAKLGHPKSTRMECRFPDPACN